MFCYSQRSSTLQTQTQIILSYGILTIKTCSLIESIFLCHNNQLPCNLKMMKGKNKIGGQSSRERLPPRPKPDFTTDFVDREKYKLSESEMIQKKAALQSKHREQASQELNERRKKLQMGIIDEQTRKVYETALTSKNIDLNPTVRRNLSQMIQYERQNQKDVVRKTGRDGSFQKRDSSCQARKIDKDQIQQEMIEAQNFIKKFQRAKKMDNIQRAVHILTNQQKKSPIIATKKTTKSRQKSKERKPPIFQNQLISGNVLNESRTSLNTSTNEEILSNIEQTIKFMQQRLFSAGRVNKLKKQHKQKQHSTENSRSQQLKTSYSDLPFKSNQTLANDFNSQLYKETLEISQLKVNNYDSDEENQCLDTIRRMKDMIDSKQSFSQQPFMKNNMKENIDYGNTTKEKLEDFSTVQKQTPHYTQSDAQIQFSLTINNSQQSSLEQSARETSRNSQYFSAKFGVPKKTQQDQYQRLKKSLFEQVNRLQIHSMAQQEHSFHAKTQQNFGEIDESSIPNLRYQPTPSPATNKKVKKPNLQLQKLKNQINGTRSNVEALRVEPIPQGKAEVVGMDFRGSFNIKKNIVYQ